MARADKEVTEDKKAALQESDEQIKLKEIQKGEEVSTVGKTMQKKYVVVHDFKDLKDSNTVYIKGDIYPAKADQIVDEDRVKELSSTKNKMGRVLIKEQG